jgi:hypothetical protein
MSKYFGILLRHTLALLSTHLITYEAVSQKAYEVNIDTLFHDEFYCVCQNLIFTELQSFSSKTKPQFKEVNCFHFNQSPFLHYFEDIWGNKVGRCITYFPNSAIKEFGDYYNGFKIGVHMSFYENGTCESIGQYNCFGEQFEHEIIYTDDNVNSIDFVATQIITSVPIDKKCGEWRYFDRQGGLIKTEIF